MDDNTLIPILFRHGIPAEFHPDFKRLVQSGKIKNERFGQRLADWYSFNDCLCEILETLSEPYKHLFGAPRAA